MADVTITQLTSIGAGLDSADEVPVWDVSGAVSRKTTVAQMNVGMAALAAANVFSQAQQVPQLLVDDANHSLDTNGAGAFVFTSQRMTIVNATAVAIGTGIGLLFLLDMTNGYVACFSIQGGLQATQEIFDPSSKFTAAKNGATSINVYWETSSYYVQNYSGVSKNVAMFLLTA